MNALVLLCCLVFHPQPDNLVLPLSGAPQILIPVAGNTPGENGTYFRSDIVLLNLRNASQRVHLRWIPQLGSASPAPVAIDIPARNALRVEDFVGQVLGITGLGSILITGMAGDQTADPGAILYATSRIWTPQPNTGGTTSQSLSTIPLSAINTPAASIFGLRRDSRYRVNVGVVNLDQTRTQTFQVYDPIPLVNPPVVHTITLPPLTMQQIGLTRTANDDVPQILVMNVTAESSRSNVWVAYGSSVDNVTGDSWSELGVAGTP